MFSVPSRVQNNYSNAEEKILIVINLFRIAQLRKIYLNMWKTLGAIAGKYRNISALISGQSLAVLSLQGLFSTSRDA